MRSRMDRYNMGSNSTNLTRSSKNKNLYTSLDNNVKETTITDVRNANAIELTTATKNYRTREGYHKIKDYSNIVEPPKVKKQLDDINFLYHDQENKVYDINSVIEEAKKNRNNEDELEEKRKIKNDKYTLTKEEIEKYREEKKKETVPDREKMKDLINTITSKTLSGELDQKTSVDLLSNLMATDKEDRVGTNDNTIISQDTLDQQFLNEVQAKEKLEQTSSKEMGLLKDMDESFYTKSMDLSDKDFDLDDEFVEKKKGFGLIKFFLILLLIALIAVLVYFIIESF